MLSSHLVVACTTDEISKVKRQFPEDGPCPIAYVYLGKDFSRLRQWEQKLGARFSRIDIARLLDKVADDIREDHVRWIDQLNRRYGQDLEWWFGTISSRNIYESNLFQYCCYMETLRRLWEAGYERPHLVLLESWGLAGAVIKWAKQNEIPVKVRGGKAFYQKFIQQLALSVLRWGYFTFTVMLRVWAASASSKKVQPKCSSLAPLAVVDTFVHESCWSGNGTYQERYFPGLLDFLRTQGFQVLIHPVLHGVRKSYLPIYQRMRQDRENFIIAEDFLKFSDYLTMLTFPLRACRRKIKATPFRGFDFQDILWEENLTMGNTSSLMAALIYRLVLRLGETGLRPRIIINWYENQVIDKALIAGARRAFPGTTIIGAQIFMYFLNVINLAPSQSEAEAGLVPHELLATSKYHCQASQAFTPEIPCVPAAALRYAHIFEQYSSKGDQDPDRPIILVLLPFLIAESLELLSIVEPALEDFPGDAPVWIKCHPDYGPAALKRSFGPEPWPKRFIIFEGALPEALKRARVVISSASSAVVEALTRGIPVLTVGKQTALTVKFMGSEDISFLKECFTALDLAEGLKQVFGQQKQNSKQQREEGEKIRELFFTPVTPQTMLPYLGTGGKG